MMRGKKIHRTRHVLWHSECDCRQGCATGIVVTAVHISIVNMIYLNVTTMPVGMGSFGTHLTTMPSICVKWQELHCWFSIGYGASAVAFCCKSHQQHAVVCNRRFASKYWVGVSNLIAMPSSSYALSIGVARSSHSCMQNYTKS